MNGTAALGGALALALATSAAGAAPADCAPVAAWVSPEAPGKPLERRALLARLAAKRVVLLGETHENAEHHRWQLQTIAALQALRPELVLALEMFPRRVQPALDRWVAGELSEADFLAASEWRKVWSFEAQLYLPIFHLARMHRIPMLALNVEPEFTRAVRAGGFDSVAPHKREGVTRPAPVPEAYVDYLLPIYAEHERKDAAKPPAVERNDAAFRRFVESQATWDRAMAQAIGAALERRPGALVVGLLGSGHIVHGYGVPHQLRDLGVREVAVLLPWDRDTGCAKLVAGIADAAFGVAAPAEKAPGRPRLGVMLETGAGGIRIRAVEKGSIAEAAGLRQGDLIVEIAGAPVKEYADVRDAVQRQAPGTWLPLRIARAGEQLEILAKFPRLAREP
jgi:uncharacterized iron-regulated protein